MNQIVKGLEDLFAAFPLSLLEVWGQFGYFIGLALMLLAFGGFTLRPGGRWGLGLERQVWDAKALLSIPITFALIFITGYLGSSIVLVPGAQTFESLKDLSVFLCIVLFGIPALIIVPFAYGLSDLIEGVPPDFLLGWLPGYFINPACFWLAHQLIGRNPDFRQLRVWGRYLLFVLIFMGIEPQLWGFICADRFTAEISFRTITPALFFTTSVTWVLAPFAMLLAFPLARRLGLFWAEIPHHVRQRRLGEKDWVWVNRDGTQKTNGDLPLGLPIRMFLVTPFIALVLLMVGATAYFTLHSAENGANKLGGQLQREIGQNLVLRLDDIQLTVQGRKQEALGHLLSSSVSAVQGRAFLLDRQNRACGDPQRGPTERGPTDCLLASSHEFPDAVLAQALEDLPLPMADATARSFMFDVVTAKPLSRETWLAQAELYPGPTGELDWVLVTAIPAAYFLEGVRVGNSQSASVFALALMLSLVVAAILASMVTSPIRRIAVATQALAEKDLSRRVPGSPLEELDALSRSFNNMATQLQDSFSRLLLEVETRKKRELELEQSESRLRLGEERLQLAARAADLGIWDWYIPKNELIWDDTMYQIFGVVREDFSCTYEGWAQLLHPDDRERAKGDVDAALVGRRPFDTEFRVCWADGSVHFIKGAAQVLRDAAGKPQRMVGVNYDITAQKRAEQELLRHRDHLEELVEKRTRALSVAVAQAQAANDAKSTFLANMSHELRTPLNAVLGFSALLRRNSAVTPEQAEKLAIISKAGEHLLNLINDVLDMSKIESGRMNLSLNAFDLLDLAGDLIDLMRSRTDEKHLQLLLEPAPDLPRYIRADESKLRQILINLLSNAIKNTEKGGVVLRLGTRFVEPRIGLLIEVEDSGVGIRPEAKAKIFEAFVQSGKRNIQSGTGLGLAITREFVHLMGGTIEVESVPGRGSLFRIEMEVDRALAQDLPKSDNSRGKVVGLVPDQPEYRLLVVEDQPEAQMLLEAILTELGFAVRLAGNGAEGVAQFQEWHPHLIWMDRRMPVMDGFDATRRIRSLPGGAEVKIIALSASVFQEERDEMLAAGLDGFVRKPFRIDEIHECLAEHLGVRYVYEETLDAKVVSPGRQQLQKLVSLPEPLRAELEAALMSLDGTRIDSAIHQVSERDMELAATLKYYADNLDYAAILSSLAQGRGLA